MRYIFIGLIFVAILFSGCVKETPKACTMEAKLCPDGSYVGRTGQNCEFSPCPGIYVNQSILMKYQPMQCQETPWQTWYKEGHIQYIMAPTDEQLLIGYLSWNNITVSSAKKIQTDEFVCQACDTCPMTYYYAVIAEQKDKEKLVEFGFMEMQSS